MRATEAHSSSSKRYPKSSEPGWMRTASSPIATSSAHVSFSVSWKTNVKLQRDRDGAIEPLQRKSVNRPRCFNTKSNEESEAFRSERDSVRLCEASSMSTESSPSWNRLKREGCVSRLALETEAIFARRMRRSSSECMRCRMSFMPCSLAFISKSNERLIAMRYWSNTSQMQHVQNGEPMMSSSIH